MVAPKEPRKKSPPRSGPGSGKRPINRPKENCNFYKMYQTEEGRAKIAEWRKKQKETGVGRKKGQPDGIRWDEYKVVSEKAQAEAKEIVKVMAEKFNIENQYAKEALETAVTIMREPQSVDNKLKAAKLVLEYTKEKPSQKSEVTVQRAEDFLAAILKAEESGPEAS